MKKRNEPEGDRDKDVSVKKHKDISVDLMIYITGQVTACVRDAENAVSFSKKQLKFRMEELDKVNAFDHFVKFIRNCISGEPTILHCKVVSQMSKLVEKLLLGISDEQTRAACALDTRIEGIMDRLPAFTFTKGLSDKVDPDDDIFVTVFLTESRKIKCRNNRYIKIQDDCLYSSQVEWVAYANIDEDQEQEKNRK